MKKYDELRKMIQDARIVLVGINQSQSALAMHACVACSNSCLICNANAN